MGENRRECRIWVAKLSWEDNIKTNFQNPGCAGVDLMGSGWVREHTVGLIN